MISITVGQRPAVKERHTTPPEVAIQEKFQYRLTGGFSIVFLP